MIKKSTSYRYFWIILIVLMVATMFSSCSGRVSSTGLSPTDVMETSMAFVKTEVVQTLTAVPTSTPTFSPPRPSPIPPTQTPSYDRHDPEAVVRAYLDAWERMDENTMNLLFGTSYRSYGFELIDSIQILEIQLVSNPSSTQRTYRVWYDVQYTEPNKGNGKTKMMFYLAWDVNRDAWIIADHGYE